MFELFADLYYVLCINCICFCLVGSWRFTKEHEYIHVTGEGVGTVGITDFAQKELGDIVYVELPEVNAKLEKGETFGSVESVKASSNIYSPVTGTVS